MLRTGLATVAGLATLALTTPFTCVSASGDPGPCWNVVGVRVPGNAETSDTIFFAFGLPLTLLAVWLVLRLTRNRAG